MGAPAITGPVTGTGVPQLSRIRGGTGVASPVGQGTVEPASGGPTKVGGVSVTIAVPTAVQPFKSVTVTV